MDNIRLPDIRVNEYMYVLVAGRVKSYSLTIIPLLLKAVGGVDI